MSQTNWAGNVPYTARDVRRPMSVDEVCDLVARTRHVRALGTRHSFGAIGDSPGELIDLVGLDPTIDIDESGAKVTVSAGISYAGLGPELHDAGIALHNMASIPHLAIAGAIATGTHGSGDRNGGLATAVAALDIVGPDGNIRRIARGDEQFEGHVVSLGALGIVTRVTLDVRPSFEVAQSVFADVAWAQVVESFDDVTSNAYSVSLFTTWVGDCVPQILTKSVGPDTPTSLLGVRRQAVDRHPVAGYSAANVTRQGGVPGPWHERLPHFKAGVLSSQRGLQSEYFVPRAEALPAIEALRALGPRLVSILLISEIRTIAGDSLWMSGASDTDTVGFHFTWGASEVDVRAAVIDIEDVLAEHGARPHWGKLFSSRFQNLTRRFPRLADFADLVQEADPGGKFGNETLDQIVGRHERDSV